jgi:hypothetical protein
MYLSSGLSGVAPLGGARAGRSPLVIRVPAIRRGHRGMGIFPGDPMQCYNTQTGDLVPCSSPGAAPVPVQTPGYMANIPYGSPAWKAALATYTYGWVPCAGNADCPASGYAANPSYPGQTAPGQGPAVQFAPAPTQAPLTFTSNDPMQPVAMPSVQLPMPSQASPVPVQVVPVASAPSVSLAPVGGPAPAASSPAGAGSSALSDFFSSSFGIAGYQVPAVVMVGGALGLAWMLFSGGKGR